MNLGFYYHIPAELENGQILMPGYLGCFLDTLADYFDELFLFQHHPNYGENVHFDYSIQSKNVSLISLPSRRSVPYRMLHSREFLGLINDNLSIMDGFLIRGPTPLLSSISKSVKPLPTIFLLVGDYLAGVDSSMQPWWRKELIRLWSRYNQQQQLKVAQKSLVFVNNQGLYQKYRGKIKVLKVTRTTTLSDKDFFKREDTCHDRPIHLLYTGRMDPAKGLLDIVEALGLLVKQGEEVVLDLVGWPEKGSDILSKIREMAEEEAISERVVFHGYQPVGPELFAFYRNADIYIIASQTSEGFPRTIWEAMAHSLPVVATRVGSIPDFIEGAAVLVPPRNPQQFAAGIKQLIDNPEIRQQNIKKGLSLAQKNTLEVQVGEMSKMIQAWIDGHHE